VRPLAQLLRWEAITSLGESAAETALLLRAGLNNVGPSHFIDAAGGRVVVCAAPALPAHMPAADRIMALAAHALHGLWMALESDLARSERPFAQAPIVLLALPERFAAAENHQALNLEGEAFIAALRSCLPTGLASAEIEAFPYGRAAGALALRRAVQHLGDDRLVVWGGVDTLHDWTVLKALEAADRLVTADNIDGIRPGEGAAFALVGSVKDADAISVLALGLGREPYPVGSEQPSHAVGLSQALEAAVKPLRAAQLRTNNWWLDLTHEEYSTQALQNTIARFSDVLGTRSDMQMPLKELGDVGAAAMPLLAVLGAEAWRLGHANDRTAIVTGCSDNGARGAMLMGASSTFTLSGVGP
jgi:3-oxoacyl-[acyl-carrier-protein] synthase I